MRTIKWKVPRFAAAILVAGASLGLANLVVPGSASADPAYANPGGAVVGVGSDTIQDILDAYTGADPYPPASNAKFYPALHAGNSGANAQVSSFDAIPAGGSTTAPGCITTKTGGPSFDRPDGSGEGINALLATLGSTGYQNGTPSKRCVGALVNVQGQIDFARSSRAPKTSGSTLTFVPFARDALSVAYFDHGTNELVNLTLAQLQALYNPANGGVLTLGNGHVVKACGVNSASGTISAFASKLGLTIQNILDSATASGCGSNYEEHGGDAFWTFASTLTGTDDAVIPMSASNWVCQMNGYCKDRSSTARANLVDVAYLDGSGGVHPYAGSTPNVAVDSAFISGFWGRDVYIVVITARITGGGTGFSLALRQLFVNTASSGNNAAICQSAPQATAQQFGLGLLAASACGSTGLTGNS